MIVSMTAGKVIDPIKLLPQHTAAAMIPSQMQSPPSN